MRSAQMQAGALAPHVPEDLRAFHDRLASHNVQVDIAVPGPSYELPDPIEVEGPPLSEVVRQTRDG